MAATTPAEKSLDIDTFICDVAYGIQNIPATCGGGKPFYGRVIFCFENGQLTRSEKHEVIK